MKREKRCSTRPSPRSECAPSAQATPTHSPHLAAWHEASPTHPLLCARHRDPAAVRWRGGKYCLGTLPSGLAGKVPRAADATRLDSCDKHRNEGGNVGASRTHRLPGRWQAGGSVGLTLPRTVKKRATPYRHGPLSSPLSADGTFGYCACICRSAIACRRSSIGVWLAIFLPSSSGGIFQPGSMPSMLGSSCAMPLWQSMQVALPDSR